MLSSIHPFGERSRNSRWWLTVTAYLIGSLAGGASMGAVFGLAGSAASLGGQAALAVLAVAAIVGVAADVGLFGLRVPTISRQVNERWLMAYRGWVYGLGFGYQLGLGLVTIVTTSTVWLMWLAAALTGSVVWGTLVGTCFGAIRGAFILMTATVHQPDDLRLLHRSIASRAGGVHRLAVMTAGLTALTAAWGATL